MQPVSAVDLTLRTVARAATRLVDALGLPIGGSRSGCTISWIGGSKDSHGTSTTPTAGGGTASVPAGAPLG